MIENLLEFKRLRCDIEGVVLPVQYCNCRKYFAPAIINGLLLRLLLGLLNKTTWLLGAVHAKDLGQILCAVDGEGGPGRESGLIIGEKQNHARNVFRLSQMADGNFGDDFFQHFG